MNIQILAYVFGTGLLAVSAHANITWAHGGHYTSAGGLITIGLAAGIGIGAITSGRAWSDKRYTAALIIAFAVLICEGFGLSTTAERLVAERDQAQLPFTEALAKRADAKRALDAAIADHLAIGNTSSRLAEALKAAAAADQATRDKASDKHCAANCAALLRDQAAAAQTEVRNARTELDDKAKAAALTVASARTALAAIPASRSSTPLADKLGVAPWKLDLFMAALASLGLNGLAACLLAYGAHTRHEPRHDQTTVNPAPPAIALTHPVPSIVAPPPVRLPAPQAAIAGPAPNPTKPAIQRPTRTAPVPTPAPQASPTKLIHDFALASIRPSANDHIFLGDLTASYHRWCGANDHTPADDATFANTMSAMFKSVGLAGIFIDGQPAIKGVMLIKQMAHAA